MYVCFLIISQGEKKGRKKVTLAQKSLSLVEIGERRNGVQNLKKKNSLPEAQSYSTFILQRKLSPEPGYTQVNSQPPSILGLIVSNNVLTLSPTLYTPANTQSQPSDTCDTDWWGWSMISPTPIALLQNDWDSSTVNQENANVFPHFGFWPRFYL